MVGVIKIQTVCLQRLTLFQNQPHQIKPGEQMKNFDIYTHIYTIKVEDDQRIVMYI